MGVEPEVTFVGGMARQDGMLLALEGALGMVPNVPPEPDLVAALGAALLGLQRSARMREEVFRDARTRRDGADSDPAAAASTMTAT